MWKILQCNFEGKDLGALNHGLFHESFLRDDDETTDDAANHEEHTFEMQISRHPTVEVDLTNGQARPPYSDQRSAEPTPPQARQLPQHQQQQHGQQVVNGNIPPPSDARTSPLLYAPFPQAHAAPWAMPSTAPIIDMTYDPFYQFQDLGTPADGAWEVGNL
jgi:hypothetical protein